MSSALDLDRFENWMQRIILSPLKVEEAVARHSQEFGINTETFADLIPDGPELSGADRLGIYSRMIGLRFMESMDEDFIGVMALVGRERFSEIAKQYLIDRPSQAHSLNQLGAGFADWLANDSTDLEHREFASELARVERSILDVYEGPDASTLSVDDLLALPKERWSEARFAPSPSLKLFECQFPTSAYLSEAFAGRTPAIPTPAETFLAVHRSNWRVSRTDLSREEYALLTALFRGATLGEAFEAALSDEAADVAGLMQNIGKTFEHWTAKQFFRSAEI